MCATRRRGDGVGETCAVAGGGREGGHEGAEGEDGGGVFAGYVFGGGREGGKKEGKDLGSIILIPFFRTDTHTATLFFSTHADLLASPALLSSSPLPTTPSSSSASSSSSSSPLSSFFGGELPLSLSLMTFQKISCKEEGEKWTTLPIQVEDEEEDEEGREEGVRSPPRFILRLAHQFAVGEDPQELSQPVTVDLAR